MTGFTGNKGGFSNAIIEISGGFASPWAAAFPEAGRCRRKRRSPGIVGLVRRIPSRLGRKHAPECPFTAAARSGAAGGREVFRRGVRQMAGGQRRRGHLRDGRLAGVARQDGDQLRLGHACLGRHLHVRLGAGVRQVRDAVRRQAAADLVADLPPSSFSTVTWDGKKIRRGVHAVAADAVL